MWVTETHVAESLRDYLSGVIGLAADELQIPRPRLVFYKPWVGVGEILRDLPSESIGGFAAGADNMVALDATRNLDTLLHVCLHEVRHLKTSVHLKGAAGERDACGFAHEFQSRRLLEILKLLSTTGAQNDRYQGTRNHDCEVCAIAAETR